VLLPILRCCSVGGGRCVLGRGGNGTPPPPPPGPFPCLVGSYRPLGKVGGRRSIFLQRRWLPGSSKEVGHIASRIFWPCR